MKLVINFNKALQELYDHVGFVESCAVYPVDFQTNMYWHIEEEDSEVYFGETKEKCLEPEYSNEIYTQRFYKKWVYRGKDLTMIIVDTHVDGNKFFQFFSNDKEVKIEETLVS